jgi:hypothetical protein
VTTKEKRNSINKTARVAGVLYLLMFPLSMFTVFFVRPNLIVPGDAATTANNIMASAGLFRSSIVSWLIGQTIFIFLVLALRRLLKPVNENQALVMLILALAGIPIAFVNELNNLAVLLLLSGADYLTAFEADQLHALVMFFLDLYDRGVIIAGVFWGLWLFPLGYLVFKSSFLPRILGVLLLIGGLGYVIDTVAFFLLPNFGTEITQFTFIGELFVVVPKNWTPA